MQWANVILQQTGSFAWWWAQASACHRLITRRKRRGVGEGKQRKEGRKEGRGVPWLQGRREEGRPPRGRGWNEWWAHLRLMLLLWHEKARSRTIRGSWAMASSRRRSHSFQGKTAVNMAASVQWEPRSVRLPSASLVRPPTARCFPINRQPATSDDARSEHAHCCPLRRRHLPPPPYPFSFFAIQTLRLCPSLSPSLQLTHYIPKYSLAEGEAKDGWKEGGLETLCREREKLPTTSSSNLLLCVFT